MVVKILGEELLTQLLGVFLYGYRRTVFTPKTKKSVTSGSATSRSLGNADYRGPSAADGATGPGCKHVLLSIILFARQNKTFFIWDKNYHLQLCFHLI